jgi:hypothetical protein
MRTLVIKDMDGKWYVHPDPSASPLLSTRPSEFSNQFANLNDLRASREMIQGELKREHQCKNEKTEKVGFEQGAFGNSIDDASDHDERSDGRERPKHEDAGRAPDVR